MKFFCQPFYWPLQWLSIIDSQNHHSEHFSVGFGEGFHSQGQSLLGQKMRRPFLGRDINATSHPLAGNQAMPVAVRATLLQEILKNTPFP